ncbi:MAG: hypothetical protein ABEI98_08785 [Halorhabdus sp.]
MHRRTFLGAASVSSVGALAGCGGLGGPTPLTDVEVVTEDDGMDHHLTFYQDNTEQATLTVSQGNAPEAYTDRFSLRLHLWHRPGLRTEHMAFEVRGPPGGAGVPAETYLKVPDGGPWPEFRIEKDDDLSTIIAVDDLGELGEGSLGFELIVDPTTTPVDAISVHADVTFDRTETFSGTYRAETTNIFDIVRDTDQRP